jgi:hypothetical protein
MLMLIGFIILVAAVMIYNYWDAKLTRDAMNMGYVQEPYEAKNEEGKSETKLRWVKK